MRLYVGNLPFSLTEEDLREAFSTCGTVVSVSIEKYDDGRPRGFGYVTMSSQSDGELAIENLDKTQFLGRTINVNVDHGRR